MAPNLADVLAPFRDLISGPLAEPSAFGPGEHLKSFLGYSDADLDDQSWFQDGFPEDLDLSVALDTFMVLSGLAD